MTTRRYGIGVGLLLMVGVLVFGAVGSSAWFTDQEFVPGEAQAGSLDIQVKNLTNGGIANSEGPTEAVPYAMDGLVPGESYFPALDLEIKNIGDIPAKLRISDGKTGGGQNIYNNLTVAVLEADTCPSTVATLWTVIYNGSLSGMSELADGLVSPRGFSCITLEFMLDSAATDNGGITSFNVLVTAGQEDDPAFGGTP